MLNVKKISMTNGEKSSFLIMRVFLHFFEYFSKNNQHRNVILLLLRNIKFFKLN